MSALEEFLSATIRTATPLAWAALGETVVQRAGVINLGLEGAIAAGAFGAIAGSVVGGSGLGWAAAAIAGAATALLFVIASVVFDADQIIVGTAVTIIALGATAALHQASYGSGGAPVLIATAGRVAVPGLSSLPLVGPALFDQPLSTYALYPAAGIVAWWLTHSHAGLSLRAVGEAPSAAVAAGVRPRKVQALAILFGGVMGGVAGGVLVLAQVGTFTDGMSAGRGFIAVAVVALGRWRTAGVMLATLIFGGASALQFLFQAMGWSVPYQLFLALPYLLTLVALAASRRQGRPPAWLGRPLADAGR